MEYSVIQILCVYSLISLLYLAAAARRIDVANLEIKITRNREYQRALEEKKRFNKKRLQTSFLWPVYLIKDIWSGVLKSLKRK